MTVKELASQLCTTEERIRWFGKIPKEKETLSPGLVSYIRMRHLMKTHPWLCIELSAIEPIDAHSVSYDSWRNALSAKIQELRGQNGGQSGSVDPVDPS